MKTIDYYMSLPYRMETFLTWRKMAIPLHFLIFRDA